MVAGQGVKLLLFVGLGHASGYTGAHFVAGGDHVPVGRFRHATFVGLDSFRIRRASHGTPLDHVLAIKKACRFES